MTFSLTQIALPAALMLFMNAASLPGSQSDPKQISAQYHAITESVLRITEAYYYESRLEEATAILDAATSLLENKDVNPIDRARLLYQQGRMIHYRDTISGSFTGLGVPLLQEAARIAKGEGDMGLVAAALDMIGLTEYRAQIGQIDMSEQRKQFQEALEIRKQLNDKNGLAESHFLLGLTFENKKDPTPEDKETAVEHYRKGLVFARESNDRLQSSYLLRHIGFYYLDRGELDEALSYLRESMRLREEIGFRIYLPFSVIAVGDVYLAKKDYEAAMEHYEKARTLGKSLSSLRAVVFSLISIGDVHRAAGRTGDARKRFEEALRLSQEANFDRGIEVAGSRLKEIQQSD